MATFTYNLNLTKPDMSDSISPASFNENFDELDRQVGDLNRYKATIDSINTSVDTLTTKTTKNEEDIVTALTNAKAYTDTAIGNVASALDTINGEVI